MGSACIQLTYYMASPPVGRGGHAYRAGRPFILVRWSQVQQRYLSAAKIAFGLRPPCWMIVRFACPRTHRGRKYTNTATSPACTQSVYIRIPRPTGGGYFCQKTGRHYSLSSVKPSAATLFERSENCVWPQAAKLFLEKVCGVRPSTHFPYPVITGMVTEADCLPSETVRAISPSSPASTTAMARP